MSLRDAERLKDKIEVSLDSRQIFFLFFGGAVVACLVFVLGVMVGRRLEGREQMGHNAGTSAAVDPLAALDQLGADEAAPKQAQPSAAPDKDEGDLAFPAALGTAAGRAAAAGAPIAPLPAAEPTLAAKPQIKPDRPDAKSPTKPSEPVAAAAAPTAKPVDPKPVAKPAVAKKVAAKKGKFTLQLSSFQSREEADAFAAKLTTAGYKPFIVESTLPDKGTWFRVRLGEYVEHDEAIAAKAEFEKQERVIAYVTKL